MKAISTTRKSISRPCDVCKLFIIFITCVQNNHFLLRPETSNSMHFIVELESQFFNISVLCYPLNILHDPTSGITKVCYMNKQFLINIEKRFFDFYWYTTSKYKVFIL